MEIGIIGTGNMGRTHAKYLVQLGHQVKIANASGPESLKDLAEKIGANPVTVEEAANAKDIVMIAIPANAIPKLPIDILSASKAIIIDTGNYYPSRDGKNTDIENGLTDSEWVAKVINHPVVKAFNNIVASSFINKAVDTGSPNRIALSVAGNEEKDKQVVKDLVEKIGFDAIDGGSLSESWRQQPGEEAYCNDLDKEVLEAALKNADISKRADNIAIADEIARPYF
jgi:predicted dinucleotide-binding enzyme